MISVGEVICVFDDNVRPPKPKLVVCVCPSEGMFFRINSNGHWPGSVPISKKANTFLRHDSFVACDGPMELDDTIIDEGIRQHGVLGRVDATVMSAIVDEISNSRRISSNDKEITLAAIREGGY